jgi:hypothetical protein
VTTFSAILAIKRFFSDVLRLFTTLSRQGVGLGMMIAHKRIFCMEISLGTLVGLLTASLLLSAGGIKASAADRPPPQWTGLEIGKASVTSSFEQQGQSLAVKGAGADIWRESDGFYFVYIPWDGDGQMIARAAEVGNSDPWAKAGIMFREDLTPRSRHAMIAMTPEKGAVFLRRVELNGLTADDSQQAMRMVPGLRTQGFQQRGSAGVQKAVGSIVSARPPRWIKLVRRGDLFTAFDSADGVNWEWSGTDRIPMAASGYVGFAVSGHDIGKVCAAVFDHVDFGPVPTQGPVTRSSTGAGTGLKGTYFNSRDHSGPSLERIDGNIDFDWGLGSPMEGIRDNEFTARWEGELEAPTTEPYLLQLASDDRARLWLNGDLVIDEWYEHGEAKSTAVVNLEAGRRYLIRLDFFENRGRAMVKLAWSSPSIPLQPIPGSQLYPAITDANGNGLPDLWEAAEGLTIESAIDPDRVVLGEKLSPRQKYLNQFSTTLSPRRAKSELPNPWLHDDIGRLGLEGEVQRTNGNWTVSSSGADIWANSDGFHFLYQLWKGDGEIVARVLSQDKSDPWAKSGVMIRETLEAESRHVMTAVTPENGVLFMQRSQNAGPTAADSGGASDGAVWLKLSRQGNAFASFRSADGQTWQWLGTEEVNLPDELYFGLAVNSHDNSSLATATFGNVSVRKLSSDGKSTNRKTGTGTGLLATYYDSASGHSVTRVDPQVDFDWGLESPLEGFASDYFSARWEGWLEAASDELYALDVLTDDGSRLWLDGKLLIDAWSDRAASHATVQIQLKANQRYALKLEYYEREKEAVARLLWSTPSLARQPIPQSQLYPANASSESAISNASDAKDQPSAKNDGGLNGSTAAVGGVFTNVGLTGLPQGVTAVTTVFQVSPTNFVNALGQWGVDDPEIYAIDRRGAVEYDLNVPNGDIFQLEIEGQSNLIPDLDSGFYLVVSMDGEYLARTLLDTERKEIARAHLLTPYLNSGTHRLRIFWDNARKGRSLRLKAVRLQSLDGPDADGDGMKDWVKAKLLAENGIDLGASHAGEPLTSLISPACLEGMGKYVGLAKLKVAGTDIVVHHGAGDRWYADASLSASGGNPIEISFQNGGLLLSNQVVWKPLNLLDAEDVIIRKGDALLLSVADKDGSTEGLAKITVAGVQNYIGGPGQVFPHRFDQAGTFEVAGTLSPAKEKTRAKTIHVLVLEAASPANAAACLGKARSWIWPGLPAEAVVEGDSLLDLQPQSGDTRGRAFMVTSDSIEPRTIVARAGVQGPVLARTQVEGFRLDSGMETDFAIIEELTEGSQLIEMGIVASPLLPQVRLEVCLIVGGVLFDDGTVVKEIDPASLQPLGETSVRFIRPAGIRTSVCHKLKAWQNDILLGVY